MSSGGTATVVVGVDPVAFGSRTRPFVDEIELVVCSFCVSVDELDGVGLASTVELAKVVSDDEDDDDDDDDEDAALVLVDDLDDCVLVVGESDLMVVTVTPGHRLAIPSPFWKTPMILNSPTSTSAHLFFTLSPIWLRPRTQAALHVAPGWKSPGTHPEMAE